MKKKLRAIMSVVLVLPLVLVMVITPVVNASQPSKQEIEEGSNKMPAYQRDSMKKFEDTKGTFSIDWNAASITKMAVVYQVVRDNALLLQEQCVADERL